MTMDNQSAAFDDLDEGYEPPSVGKMVVASGVSDRTIEKHFETGRLRVIQEKSEIFLSHVVDFLGDAGGVDRLTSDRVWGNLRPEYQRRLRWDNKKKSKLIESFIMNVPVPPVFLYEKRLGRFEVMDGQQRLNAIAEFVRGEFSLEGLEIWQALNGRTYSKLPPLVRRGLERAKISAITLMSDNAASGEDSLDLRAQVFERLNTGGERLNPQELRNSLYSGSFNELVIRISGWKKFTDAWDIPNHEEHIRQDGSASEALKDNPLYKRMQDVEVALRFFAFMEPQSISGSVRGMLDGVMRTNRAANAEKLKEFSEAFEAAIDLCIDVFGEMAFRLPSTGGKPKTSRPLFDAQMVAMHINRDNAAVIRANRDDIRRAVLQLAQPGAETYDLMVGRGNTAQAIKDRISKVAQTISEVIDANS